MDTSDNNEQNGGGAAPVTMDATEQQQQQPNAGGDTNTGGGDGGGAGGDTRDSAMSKGNEDRKIFVGGVSYDTSNEDLLAHFGTFGEVAQAQVKFDRMTGRSRGFAFVEFAANDACRKALAAREQTIKGKQVEIKPAKSRENKKVFVGGLPSDFDEADLRTHFEQYGKVEDIEWPFDKQRNAKRNFAFIVFEEEDSADKASAVTKQTFADRECDVKKAVPQGRRGPMNMIGGARGGRGGGRGGWNGGQGGWMGGGGYGGAGGGGWGDWYGQAAAGYGAGYGGGGYGGGYGGGADDYSSNAYSDYWGGAGGGAATTAAWNQYGAGAYDAAAAAYGGQQARRGAGGYQQHY